MAEPAAVAVPMPTRAGNTGQDSRAQIQSLAANEMIFGVVGPVGSGTSWVALALKVLLEATEESVQVQIIKASKVISTKLENTEHLDGLKAHDRASLLQSAGDDLRAHDHAAVAKLLVKAVKQQRETWIEEAKNSDGAVALRPKETPKRVYILDSLKHPAEEALLRSVYREAFCLIGVVCETSTRRQRLRDHKCREAGADQIEALMQRDEDEDLKHGQKVADTFHRADFFVDNTPPRFIEGHVENKEWVVNEKLGRLLDILSGTKIIRPQASESGMFHAEAAKLRSACLSRQVGAAITDQAGNVIATGTNEVPMAGGGVYGSNFAAESGRSVPDHRCAVVNGYCSNNRVQDEIMQEVINAIPALRAEPDVKALKAQLKKTALGRLLEFSRAVHAEMDALLSAARTGSSTVGAKVFVTTFPCHYCARHLVAAGIDEVQFIEPYPKSRALDLHSDAIEQSLTKWTSPRLDPWGKVLFRPFTGVAPRFYKRAFLKNRDYKGSAGEMKIQEPSWETGLLKESYLQVETKLSEAENG